MFNKEISKTLKGIRDVRLDNRKVLRAPGPRIKYFERLLIVELNIVVVITIVKKKVKQ